MRRQATGGPKDGIFLFSTDLGGQLLVKACKNRPAAELVGRKAELSVLAGLAARARTGRPGAVLLTGPTGIGRSALLEAFLLGAGRDTTVLRARCTDGGPEAGPGPESGHATIWTLLAGTGRAPSGIREPGGRGSGSTVHARLAHWHRAITVLLEQGPLIVAVDDVHRCDRQSLRSLAFTLRRAAGLPLLVIATAPAGTAAQGNAALTELLAQGHWHSVELAPLTPDAIAELVGGRLGGRATDTLNRTCFEASQGNPGLLNGLLAEVCGTSEPEARPLASVGRQLAEDALLADLRRRPGTLSVAVAMAVLDTTAVEPVAGLSGLPIRSVHSAAEELRRHGALSAPGSRLASETLRQSLLGTLGLEELSNRRSRAAQLLEDTGRPIGEVADVLLTVRELGEPWMADALYGAAHTARLRGDSATAVRYLTHCLRPSASEPASVSRMIRGRAAGLLATTDPNSALPHLRRLLELDGYNRARPGLAANSSARPVFPGDVRRCVQLLCQMLDEPDGTADGQGRPEAGSRTLLDSALLLSGGLDRSAISWVRDRDGVAPARQQRQPGNPRLVSAHALLSTLGGVTAAAVAEKARSGALRSQTVVERHSVVASALMLHLADQNEPAIAALDHLLSRDPGNGPDQEGNSVQDRGPDQNGGSADATVLTARATVRYGIGDLDAAHDDAERAVSGKRELGWQRRHSALTALATILGQQGDFAGAATVLRLIDQPGYRESLWGYPAYLWTRAALERRRGDLEAALGSLYACGERLREAGVHNPVFLPWWVEAAGVLTALDRPNEAREATDYGDELAERWGTPRSVGLSLLARGTVAAGRSGTDLLTEACEVLAASPARLACAQAEHALGVVLLRADDVHTARLHLRRAFDLSVQCGALGLGSTVRELLVATGGRVGPITGSRVDALTGSERRVATLAAGGLSNPDIAATLVVALRTVELHLTNTYRKLGISRRGELAAVLDQAPPGRPRKQAARKRAVG